mgnify:CR=1 FL=1
MSNIIVVDDDPTFSGLLRTVLEFEGYQVLLVPTPGDVVPRVRETKPVLVLMDVHAEQGDTLGVLRDLRKDENLKDVLVVMTSGMDRSAECLEAGADEFLLKPFRPDELTTLIGDLIGKRDAGA